MSLASVNDRADECQHLLLSNPVLSRTVLRYAESGSIGGPRRIERPVTGAAGWLRVGHPYARWVVWVGDAPEIAVAHLARRLPRRTRHVQGVARQADRIAAVVGADGELLVAAAWLHDIGYAPELADTGFHPLDGARFLRHQGVDGRLCGLVAHHSCAVIEAEMRGLAAELLAEFPREESVVSDALTYCDLTTGPDGQRLTVDERLAEIVSRYGPDSLVGRFIDQARQEMIGAVRRTEERLRGAGVEP